MHVKRQEQLEVGGQVSSGSRTLRLDVTDDGGARVTLTTIRGEEVEIVNPTFPDFPWIGPDPGEGTYVRQQFYVPWGHKIRVGAYRQFRIFPNLGVVIVEPANGK